LQPRKRALAARRKRRKVQERRKGRGKRKDLARKKARRKRSKSQKQEVKRSKSQKQEVKRSKSQKQEPRRREKAELWQSPVCQRKAKGLWAGFPTRSAHIIATRVTGACTCVGNALSTLANRRCQLEALSVHPRALTRTLIQTYAHAHMHSHTHARTCVHTHSFRLSAVSA
jgi:hypothetical protein